MTSSRSFSEILDECLDRVLLGGEAVEACLADFPEHAAWLRDELDTALALRGAFAYQPDVERKRANRLRMYAALERRPRGAWPRLPRLSGLLATGPRFAVAALVAVVALLGTGTGTVMAAQGSAPGDILYPVKRTTERVQLAFTFTDAREVDFREDLLQRRIDELDTITTKGREQFVPELVEEIVRHSDRAQELTTGPIRKVVSPAGGPPSSDPEPSDDPREPVPTPRSPREAEPGEKEVSVRPVLALADRLAGLEKQVASLEDRVTHAGSRADLQQLQRALTNTRSRLNALLDQADEVHAPPAEEPEAPPGQVDGPREPELPPSDRPGNDVPSSGEPTMRVKARIMDVKLHQVDGRLVRVDVVVELANGNHRPVQVTRGGTKLLKDGESAGVRDLRPGAQVVLVVERQTGKVAAIVVPEDDDQDEDDEDGEDDDGREEGRDRGLTRSRDARSGR